MTYFSFNFKSPPAVQYVSKHSKGQIAVVENEEQLQKFLKIKSDLPDLKGIYFFGLIMSQIKLEKLSFLLCIKSST